MIEKKVIKKWKMNKGDRSLFAIYVGFDKSKFEHYSKQQFFDIENQILEKKKYSQILGDIFEKKIGNTFMGVLQDSKFSWVPKWMEEEFTDIIYIKRYLDSIKILSKRKKEYYGDIFVEDVTMFLDIFLDYPMKFSYQDIELYSLEADIVINISIHGTVWIIGKDLHYMKDISDLISSNEMFVLEGLNMNP